MSESPGDPIWLVFYCARSATNPEHRTTLLRVSRREVAPEEEPARDIMNLADSLAGRGVCGGSATMPDGVRVPDSEWALCTGDSTKHPRNRLLPGLTWPWSTGAFFALLAFALKANEGEGYSNILKAARFWNTYNEPPALYSAFKRMFETEKELNARTTWRNLIRPFGVDSKRRITIEPDAQRRISIHPSNELGEIEEWALPGPQRRRSRTVAPRPLGMSEAMAMPTTATPVVAERAIPGLLEDLSSLAHAEVALRSRVYVPRPKEEREIAKRIREGDTWVPVEGEAGTGKTTILQQLLHELSDDQPLGLSPIFIDGPWLLSTPGASPVRILADKYAKGASLWDLPRAVNNLLRSADRRLLVLFDTLDAILLTEHRPLVLRWLHELGDAGIPVVTSCRPLEARLAKLPNLWRAVVLRDFDDAQAREALTGYVDAYYATESVAVRRELHDRLERHYLENPAYADICRRPVTLRMLFDAYGGAYFPERLDRQQLYRDFWDAKILGSRTQRPVPSAVARKREGLATSIALLMAEGGRPHPILPGIVVERVLPKLQAGWAVFDQLRSEGVLHAPDSLHPPLQVSFFHQSFLEYAGARAILRQPPDERANWITTLLDPLGRGDGSPWLALVEEVAVQGGGTEDSERILARLAASATPGALTSAGSVWCRLPSALTNVHAEIGKRLAQDESARYACLVRLHDAPRERIRGLLETFAGAAWTSGKQNGRFTALECWARTALLYPDAVGEQLDELGVVEVAVAEKGGHLLSRVASLLAAFLGSDDNRAESRLGLFYAALLGKASARARVTLVEAVGGRVSVSARAILLLERWLETPETARDVRTLQELRGAFAVALGPVRPDEFRLEHERALVEHGGEARLRVLSVWRERLRNEVWAVQDLPVALFPTSEGSLGLFAESVDVLLGPLVQAGNMEVFTFVFGMLQETPRAETLVARRVRELAIETLLKVPGLPESVHRILEAACILDVPPADLMHHELRLLAAALPTLGSAAVQIIEGVSDELLLLRILEGLPEGPLAHRAALQLLHARDALVGETAKRLTLQLERLLAVNSSAGSPELSAASQTWLRNETRSQSSERRRLAYRVIVLAFRDAPGIEVVELIQEVAPSWQRSCTDSESNAIGSCLVGLIKTTELPPNLAAALRRYARDVALAAPANFEASRRTALLMLQELCCHDPEAARATAEQIMHAIESGAITGTNAVIGVLGLTYPVLPLEPSWAWRILRRAADCATKAGMGRYGWDTFKDSSRRILRVVIAHESAASELREALPALPEHVQGAVLECAEEADDSLLFERLRECREADKLQPAAERKFQAWARRRHGRSV